MATKKTTKAAEAKASKAIDKKAKSEPGKLSALDAAAKVLAESGEPMNAKSLIDTMAAKGWANSC